MEKLRNINTELLKKIQRKKAGIAASIFMAGTTLFTIAQAEGKTPHVYAPVPNEKFYPMVLSEMPPTNERRDLTVSISSPVLLEPTLSPKEQRISDLQSKADQYAKIAQESGRFSSRLINSLKMYGPIYIAAAEKFGIDWKMLWITHMEESGASAIGSKAFEGSTFPYVGGMQRNQEIWPDKFVKEAFKGLEYLEEIPTNHKGDAMEIVGAAAIMAPNMEKYTELGIKEAVFNTFALYTGSQELAFERLADWQIADEVFLIAKEKALNIASKTNF